MDLSKISKGGQIFAGAGLVFFIATLLPWYSVEVAGFSDSANAWGDIGFLWGSLWALLIIAGVVILVLPAFGVKAPSIPPIAYMAIGALATVFTLLKLLIGEDDAPEFGVSVDASFGLYLAIIAAAGCAFGGFMMFKESGGDLNDLKDVDKLKGHAGIQGGGGTPPPPPP
ncbi:MAG: hypothetical protein HY828_10705, partial [Actinobacteria bacterium]|nr:hypothetical protein [Actinomycetota bacterium]